MSFSAYIRLFRAPNLLIIILTMVLVRYAVIGPLLFSYGSDLPMSSACFLLLVFATVAVAAGGYVINDILDVPIDRKNHSRNVIAGGQLSETSAYYIYYGLNVAGIVAGILVSWSVRNIQLSILFLVVATMLYYYSYKYKYLVLWGNLAVAFLSGLVPVIVWLFEYFALQNDPAAFIDSFRAFRMISVIIAAYAAFAFMVTLVREILKDLEDMEGDRKGGCRTLPIVSGEKTARIWAALLAAMTLGLLVCILFAGWNQGYRTVSVFLAFTAVPVLAFIPLKLVLTAHPDYGRIASVTKICMLLGVMSMIFIPL